MDVEKDIDAIYKRLNNIDKRFGIHKDTCQTFCDNEYRCDSDFTKQEMFSAINSAYRNVAEFGIAGRNIENISTDFVKYEPQDDTVVKNMRAKLKEVLPKIITQLTIINSIAEIEDENEKLKAILVAVNLSPDETKNALYHSFGALALEKLSDGKLTWSEAVQLTEWWYLNIYKPTK